jgi:hypothetical protein
MERKVNGERWEGLALPAIREVKVGSFTRFLVILPMMAFLGNLAAQEGAPSPKEGDIPADSAPRIVEWKEGRTIAVRVPVASAERPLMTTVSFPEESIETAVAGWPEGDLTVVQKRGLLFIRLAKKSEGQLNVLGGSGTHYLLHLKGVEGMDPASYDAYLRVRKVGLATAALSAARAPRPHRRPVGALELIRAMRLGQRTEGCRILRAAGEIAYESPAIEIRLVWVYDAPDYRGLVCDVLNRTQTRQVVDASRLGAHGGGPLVASALRENALDPGASTRMYLVFWKE